MDFVCVLKLVGILESIMSLFQLCFHLVEPNSYPDLHTNITYGLVREYFD